MNELTKAALIRAHRTLIEYLASTIPAGVTITPTVLMNIDLKYTFYVIMAWMIAGLSLVGGTFFYALKTGLPEAQPAIEATEDDVNNEPAEPYPDEDNYDDLKIDENVDEGDDGEAYDDLEQEE